MPVKYTEERDMEEANSGSYTVEQAIEKIGIGRLQIKIYVICKLVVATDALEVMLLSLVGPVARCEWKLSEVQIALISSGVFLAMAASSPAMGKLADHYGRRMCLLLTTLWTAYFGLITSFAPNYSWLLLLRSLVGAGMGGIPQGYSMVAEYMPSKYRAKMIVLGEAFWGAGCLFEILLAALVTPTLGWRWLFGLSAVPVFLSSLGCMLIPESARYLMAAGYRNKAESILQKISKINEKPLPDGCLVKSPKVPLGSMRDLFSSEYARTTVLLWPVAFGIAFAYYGLVLGSPALLNDNSSNLNMQDGSDSCSSVCIHMTTEEYISLAASTSGEFAGLIVSFLLIDRIGRLWTGRILLFLATVFLFLLQVKMDRLLYTFILFGARGSTLTLFNLLFIYSVEVYPTTMRALGLGMVTLWTRLASTITPFFAQILMVYSLPITVNIYGSICLVCTLLMFLVPIETKGRPMKQTISFEADTEETKSIMRD